MKIHTQFPLGDILYYKIGGMADYVLEVQSSEDVCEALKYIAEHNISRVLPIGIGSNLLLNDQPFKGAILWFGKPRNDSISVQGNIITAFAGALLDDVIQSSFTHSLRGLEWAGGLPSTVGGAVRGNVGAFGSEIKDSVVSVEVIDLNDKSLSVETLSNKDLNFSYRNSTIKENKNLLVISATFSLKPTDEKDMEEAKELYQSRIEYRKENHALEYPSCGSVFKNITNPGEVKKIIDTWPDAKESIEQKWHGKVAMGYIIKRLGLSQYSVGGAEVSEKHGNYIVNKNKAKFTDVLEIINTIKEKFHSEFGFYPEPEVEIVS